MQTIWRTPLMLVALFVIGFMAVFGYTGATRNERVEVAPAGDVASGSRLVTAADAGPPSPRSEINTEETSPSTHSRSSATPNEATVDKWIAETNADDPEIRPAAIVALATAPKSKALPTLKRLLAAGDPQAERPLALNSLRTLALKQGDADGAIRDVLRQATSHADDEATMRGAQEALSDIERAMSEAAPGTDR